MSRRLDRVLLDAQTIVQTAGYVNPADMANLSEIAFYVTFDHTSSAGVLSIETAPTADYTGVWAVLGTVTWSAIDKCHYVAVTGVFRAIRVRISTAITAGTVTVVVLGNS